MCVAHCVRSFLMKTDETRHDGVAAALGVVSREGWGWRQHLLQSGGEPSCFLSPASALHLSWKLSASIRINTCSTLTTPMFLHSVLNCECLKFNTREQRHCPFVFRHIWILRHWQSHLGSIFWLCCFHFQKTFLPGCTQQLQVDLPHNSTTSGKRMLLVVQYSNKNPGLRVMGPTCDHF